MTPFDPYYPFEYVPRGPRTPRDIYHHLMGERGSQVTLLPPLTHINDSNMSLGVLGPLGTYVVV